MKRLNEKAMLARLTIGQWTARKIDRTVTQKVAQDYNTTSDAGRYNKILIAEHALKEIGKIVNEARSYHYEHTLPWGDDESRLLSAMIYFDYTTMMRHYQGKMEQAVDNLINNYPDLVEEARRRLNGMFKQEDYPDAEEVRGKFYFSLTINALPDAADFRVTINDEEIERIKKDIEARNSAAQDKAMRDLWTRLYECVNHAAKKLGEPDAIFRDTLIENISALCSLLPALNVMGDQALEEMRKEVETAICKYSPDTLRENKKERLTAADKADALVKRMAAYMGE